MAATRSTRSSQAPHVRGLSLVELMVGLAVGLFVLTAALAVLAINLNENRKLLLEARLLQDLRTTSDLITRDLRHAGYWGAAEQGVATNGVTKVVANPYAAAWAAGSPASSINFTYSRDAENNIVDSSEQLGYRLRAGAIEVHNGDSGWQALTDPGTFNVTEFSIAASLQPLDLGGFCGKACNGAACSPRQEIRSLTVTLGGALVGNAAVARRLQSEVRIRNDTLSGACSG